MSGNRALGVCARWFVTGLIAVFAMLLACAPAQAANCNYATAQGSTGPANWQTYCWLDLAGYNNVAARSAAGQAMSYTLPDGTVMNFTLRISGAGVTPAVAPSWGGAAVGNTAFLGIGGQPILYQTAAGTTTATISNIVMIPPAGATTITSYMFVAADAESSNNGESLSFQSNGGGWVLLDQAGPISGSLYPSISGTGTQTVTVTGVAGTVGAPIFGSSTPTSLTATIVGGGLQGVMFAVRFASIRLNLQIAGARAASADQFRFDIAATSSGTVLATGTSSGTSLGPFAAASLSTASALPLTLSQTMAAGSVNPLSSYQSRLTCINAVSSTTPLPSNVVTTSFAFGALQFGDIVTCTFTNRPYPHLRLIKALGAGGRLFNTDQFTLNIAQGGTVLATTTTGGTGSTLTTASTPQVLVTAGQTFTFSETAAGTTVLAQYTAALACTNANSGSTTALPTAPGGSVTPALGDVITCTLTNTRRSANATLTIAKTSALLSDPLNGSVNPKAIPGAVVRYSLAVTNTGTLPTDNNSVLLVDTLPASLRVGSAAAPSFVQGTPTSGLTFNPSTDIRFSNAAVPPTSFAGCTYTPIQPYDPAVRYVCLNPKGIMAGSTGVPPSFTISLSAQIN